MYLSESITTLTRQPQLDPQLYLPQMVRIARIEPMTVQEKVFTIELPKGKSLGHRPGQFMQISVMGVGEAPISITSSPSRSNGSFEMCIRKVGDVTTALHQMKPGDWIGIRGPFGRGFPYESFRGKDLLFVPGGLGFPPLRSLINQVLDERAQYGRVIILYGARDSSLLLYPDELKLWGDRKDVELHLTVDRSDENWKGHVGVVTTLFKNISIYPRNTVGVTCGPPVMYRFVLMEFFGKGISEGNIYLSMERRMKCGVGKCGHCQINNIYACQCGPVFPYKEIKGLEEAL